MRFRRGVEVVPGRTADAGIVGPSGLVVRRTVTTDAFGQFDVTVDDPHEDVRASEVGGVLELRAVAGTLTLTGVNFGNGARGSVRIRLEGAGTGSRPDSLRLTAPASVGGETVRLYRMVGSRLVLVRTVRLNPDGDVPSLSLPDRNRAARTTYIAKLVASRRVLGATSNRVPLA